jgi:YHS domain-containing protein
MAIDPVRGMEVDPATAEGVVEREGWRIGFCSAGCREQSLAEPAAGLAR